MEKILREELYSKIEDTFLSLASEMREGSYDSKLAVEDETDNQGEYEITLRNNVKHEVSRGAYYTPTYVDVIYDSEVINIEYLTYGKGEKLLHIPVSFDKKRLHFEGEA